MRQGKYTFLVLLYFFSCLFLSESNVIYAKSKTRIIYTSSISHWETSTLVHLIDGCSEPTTIVFDADYDYTIDRCIRPKTSIIVKGCGKKLRCVNKTNYVISLFDVRNVETFKIDNLILDGGSEAVHSDKTMPKEFFITIKDVKNVSFTNCTFQNIKTDFPGWKVGDEAYTIWVENYNKLTFCDNLVTNCDCPEFLKAILPKENRDPKRFADICRNKMYFVRTSSAVEVRFGRYRINNNEIGVTYGSSINAYGFDSEIIGNHFSGSHNSSSIDLSEQYMFEYVSQDVTVKNNYSEYSHDGLLMGDHVKNIYIKNNTYRADLYNEASHARYDKIWSVVERSCDLALRLDHDLSNIKIISNTFVGCHALTMFNLLGHKNNIRIEDNYIKNVDSPKRSSLVITQTENIKIKNNVFINSGVTLSYLDRPQFIVIGPTKTDVASERYVKSVSIINNSFEFSDSNIRQAYILAHTIYDKSKCNTLSSLNDFSIKKNRSNFEGDFLLMTDDFSTVNKPSISIKRNNFGNSITSGNVFDYNVVNEKVERSSVLKANTIVEKNGKKYYVILGGITSLTEQNYNTDDYIKDGSAVLRRITE